MSKAVTFTADQVTPQELRWLWKDMIPKGKLTVMCGDPGLGKSFMTLDILARLSRGLPMPGETAAEGQARGIMSGVLLSAEDDPADTIRPRLETMGADLSKAIIFDGVEQANGDVYDFVLGRNVQELYDLIRSKPDVGLVVVDPISAYVGETDSYNNAQVRAMLKPLADMAADLGVAVVLVTHLRKGEASKAVHRAMGSLAFTAAARCVLVVTKDSADPDLRLVLVAKSNLGADRVGWSYRIDDGRVAWGSFIASGADEVMSAGGDGEGSGGGGLSAKFDPAIDAFGRVIRERLAACPAGLPVAEVRTLLEQHGLTIERVSQTKTRKRLGVRAVGRGPSSVWVLEEV